MSSVPATGGGDCSAHFGDFDPCACDSGGCPVPLQGLLECGDHVGFPHLSWQSQQYVEVTAGSCEAGTLVRTVIRTLGAWCQLGVKADPPVVPVTSALAARTGALLFTELMK